MRTLISALLSGGLIFAINSFASETYLWPIKEKAIGSYILYQPNQFLGDELIYGDLILRPEEGDIIVSPVDGVITDFLFTYKHSLTSSTTYGADYFFNSDRSGNAGANGSVDHRDSKYFTAKIGIRGRDGRKVFLTGFTPSNRFQTGEIIKKGDILGEAASAYHKIDGYSLFVNVSENTIAVDPMSVFGLKSAFKGENRSITNTAITTDEMREDLTILYTALLEGHPGLYDYVSESDLETAFYGLMDEVQFVSSRKEFQNLLSRVLRLIRDSHLSIIYETIPPPEGTTSWPSISFGFLNDSLVVTRTMSDYRNFLGRRIRSVNGFEIDKIRNAIIYTVDEHDGFVESYPDFILLTLSGIRFFNEFYPAVKTRDLDILFYNGEQKQFEGLNNVGVNSCINYYPSWRAFYTHPGKRISTSMIADSIALVTIGTFDLNDLEMAQIEDFIKSLSNKQCENLILDLRNNHGGSIHNMALLFDLIYGNDFKTSEYSIVKKQGGFSFFEYTDNYMLSDTLFADFATIQGRNGYYRKTAINRKLIDEDETFTGDVFVLVNERSFSASTVFAALTKKHSRGKIIGRESGSTYSHVNGSHFANLILPNSKFRIRIPLVKIVFDTVQRSWTGWGRGVMPDYLINFSLEELEWKSDTILNTAIALITSPEKFVVDTLGDDYSFNQVLEVPKDKKNYTNALKIAGVLMITLFTALLIYNMMKNKINSINDK